MTSAAIVYYNGDQVISTRVNSDGYIEHAGKVLGIHYSSSEQAKQISSSPEIRSLDLDTGEIETFNDSKSPIISNVDNDSHASYYILEAAHNENYLYLFDTNKNRWKVFRKWSYGIIRDYIKNLNENYNKGNNSNLSLLKENQEKLKMKENIEQTPFINLLDGKTKFAIKTALKRLRGQPQEHIKLWLSSIMRDIKFGGTNPYENMSVEDLIEDFENYIQEKNDEL